MCLQSLWYFSGRKLHSTPSGRLIHSAIVSYATFFLFLYPTDFDDISDQLPDAIKRTNCTTLATYIPRGSSHTPWVLAWMLSYYVFYAAMTENKGRKQDFQFHLVNEYSNTYSERSHLARIKGRVNKGMMLFSRSCVQIVSSWVFMWFDLLWTFCPFLFVGFAGCFINFICCLPCC